MGAEAGRVSVRYRMLRWAIAGIIIAIGWTAYFLANPRIYSIVAASEFEIPLSKQLLEAIEVITCPALLTGATFHWVIPVNGVIYAIVGFAVGLIQSRADQ